MKRSIVTPTLKYRAVVNLKPTQDVNKVAEKLYRLNFTSEAKIKIRELERTDKEIVYTVSDSQERETLFLIKPVRNAAVQSIPKQKAPQQGCHES